MNILFPEIKIPIAVLFVFNWGGIKPRRTDKEVRPNLLVLAWVTNVLTSSDLYIEFSTEY